jgi:diguanylate cyclase (GGDEF)-like protein/PAS domain S-box-containing protein
MDEQVGRGIKRNQMAQVEDTVKNELTQLGESLHLTVNAVRRYQEALIASKERYRELVEQSTVITYQDEIDDCSTTIYISPQVERLFGYTADEWIQDRDLWLRIVHPEDRDRVRAENIRTNSLGEPFLIEYRVISRDGRVAWVRDNAVLIKDENGNPHHWQGVLQDITEEKRAEDAERLQRELTKALYEAGTALTSSLDLDTVLDRILEQIAVVVPYDSASVLLLRDDIAQIVRVRGYDRFGIRQSGVGPDNIDVSSNRLFHTILETRKPLVVTDTKVESDWVVSPTNQHVRSWIGAPMMSQGQVIGFLSLEKVQPGYYQSEHGRNLEILASQAALALQNARLFESAQRHAQENQMLREAAEVVTSALELEQVLDSILTQLARVVSYHSAAIFLVDGARLQVAAGRGFPNTSELIGTTFSIEDSLVRAADLNHGPIVLQDAASDPRYQAWGNIHSTRGWLGVPLYVRDEMIGFLTLDSTSPNSYGAQEASLALAFANQAAIAIDNAKLFKRVHTLAITDSLTGIFNRRHFFDLANREFERSMRFSRPLALVMWDIDHFKHVNDTYGHLAGDQVLCMVAERCRNSLREVDLLGRYGGEEFVSLLVEANLQVATEIAERVRIAVENPAYLVNGNEISISISVGVADNTDCPSLEVLLDRADQALYRAKNSGRNRVGVWGKSFIATPSSFTA